ncbi:MarR family winged helix-turn-helix transcriptional regulator [Nocardioides sp.]|uniref:MarR family winged helix-turn-helix transcriptional regulator n=1 Tax=Nocardioides sp. TaxID=35761 RepID=UPI003783F2B6
MTPTQDDDASRARPGEPATDVGRRDPIAVAYELWREHGWEDAADGMALVTSLSRVNQLMTERIERTLRPYELSFARYELLRLLAFTSTGRVAMTRLGSLLQVHPTSVTSVVARLERQGHVERLRRTTDRRVVLASITGSGRHVAEVATRALNEDVFSRPGLPLEDVRTMTRLLGSLRGHLGDMTTP